MCNFTAQSEDSLNRTLKASETMRFLGNIEAKMDAKGRVFFPATFRRELQASSEERLVMRRDMFQCCLVIYPESVWNEQLDQLRQRLNRWNPTHQMVFRQFISDVEILTLDGNGRILIPKRFQQLIHLKQGLRFIGMDDTIEVWTAEATEQPFMEMDAFAAELEKLMSNDKPVENTNA
jgi:MraZ protein